jgi:hypothetical protein
MAVDETGIYGFYRRHRLLTFIKILQILNNFKMAYAMSEKDTEQALTFAMLC